MRAPKDWWVEVRTKDGATRGERKFRAESCKAAADTAAYVILLAITASKKDHGPSAIAETPDDEERVMWVTPPSFEPPREPVRLGPDHVQAGAGRPERRRLSWVVGARGLVGAGEVPGVTTGIGLLAGMVVGSFRLEVGSTAWFPKEYSSAGDPGTGAYFRRYTAELRGCYGPRVNGWSLSGCLGARAGRLEGEGFGASRALSGTESQIGPLGGIVLVLPISKDLAVRVDTEASAPVLFRHEFLLEGRELAYRSPAISANAGIGLELHF